MTYTIGQPVMISRTYGKPEQGQVTKLGRKYGEAGAGHRKMRFVIDSGREVDGFGRIWSLEAWAENKEISEIAAKLRVIGVNVSGKLARSLPTMKAILHVLEQNGHDDD